jgi:glycosyltransferase involved in cell wall biosynthesis
VSERPPRILLVNRVYWPSTEATAQLLTDLAEGLAGRGWDVHVLAAGESSTVRHGVTLHRTGTPDRHTGLVSRAVGYRRFLRAVRTRLPALARPGDVVVALTDPPLLGTVIAETLDGRDVAVVQWIQDIYPEIAAVHFGPIAGLLLVGWRGRRNRAWSRSAACVTLGEDMAREVAATGVTPDRLAILPNWAPRELDVPAGPAEVAACRERWQAGGRFVVVYSGNLGRVHEFATILDAAERLRADKDIVLRFVGRGPQWSRVADAVTRRELTNVVLQPPVPRAELGAMLAAADAHLVTLRTVYGRLVYPSKLAGVLAAGRPALFVGPAGGDIARLLHDSDCGAAFAPGSGAALAETIRRWASNRAEAARLGAHARHTYAARFTWSRAFAGWERLLRRLAAERPDVPPDRQKA